MRYPQRWNGNVSISVGEVKASLSAKKEGIEQLTLRLDVLVWAAKKLYGSGKTYSRYGHLFVCRGSKEAGVAEGESQVVGEGITMHLAT